MRETALSGIAFLGYVLLFAIGTSPSASKAGNIFMEENMENGNTLVAYFSRSGENYKVGVVEKGSAKILASYASKMLGAPEYEIATVDGYPEDLLECNKLARKELDENARPALKNMLPDMSGVKNIVLVYPNWWGDLPMAVYSFLDKINTDGITIYPVCTHEDNGLGMTERMLSQAYPKASVQKGVAIRGSVVQSSPFQTESTLKKYLEDRGLI